MATGVRKVRKVRCPTCKTCLLEPPPPTPIFKCPICSTLLRAKGTPADYVARRTDAQTSRQHTEQGSDKIVAYKGSIFKQHMDADNGFIFKTEEQLLDPRKMENSSSNGNNTYLSLKLSDYELSFKYLKERCPSEESSDQHAAHERSTSRTEASIFQCDASGKAVKLESTNFTCDAFEPEFDFPVAKSESTQGEHPFTSLSKIGFFSPEENGYNNDNAALSKSKTTGQPAPPSDNMQGVYPSASLSRSGFFSPDENGCDNDSAALSNSQAIEQPALTVNNMQGGDPFASLSQIGFFSPDENVCDSDSAAESKGQTTEQPAPTLDNTQGGHSSTSFGQIGFFSPDENGCDSDSAAQSNSQTTKQPAPTSDNTQGGHSFTSFSQVGILSADQNGCDSYIAAQSSSQNNEQPAPTSDNMQGGHPFMSFSEVGLLSADQNGCDSYIAAQSSSQNNELPAPTSDNTQGGHPFTSFSEVGLLSADQNGCDSYIAAQSSSQNNEQPAPTSDNTQGGHPLASFSQIGYFSHDKNGCNDDSAAFSNSQTTEQPAPILDYVKGGHPFTSLSQIGVSLDQNEYNNHIAAVSGIQTLEGHSDAGTISRGGNEVSDHAEGLYPQLHSEEANANEKTSDSLSRLDLHLDINGENDATTSHNREDINSASIMHDNIASHLSTLSLRVITDDDQETNTHDAVIQTGKEGIANFEALSDVIVSEQQAEPLPMDDEKPHLVEAGKDTANVTRSVFKGDVEVEQCWKIKGKFPVFKDQSNSDTQRDSFAANILSFDSELRPAVSVSKIVGQGHFQETSSQIHFNGRPQLPEVNNCETSYPRFSASDEASLHAPQSSDSVGTLPHASDTEQLEISNALSTRVEELEHAHSSQTVKALKIKKSRSVKDAGEAFEAQGQAQIKDSKAFSARLEEVEPAHSNQSAKALKFGKSCSLKEVFEPQGQAQLKKGSNSLAFSDFTKMDRLRTDQQSRSNNVSNGHFLTHRPQCKQLTGNGKDYDKAGLEKDRKGSNTRPVQRLPLESLEHRACENGKCKSFSPDSRTQAKIYEDQSSGCSHECSYDCSYDCCHRCRRPSHLNHDMKNHFFNQCTCHACPSVFSICTHHPHIMPIHGCCEAYSMQSSSITTHRFGHCICSLCPHNMQMHSCGNFVAGCCPSSLSGAQQAEVDKRSTVLQKQYPYLPPRHTATYVPCQHCNQMLQVPSCLPVNSGNVQKLRCGTCRKVSSFSVNNEACHDRYVQSSSSSYVNATAVGTSVNCSPHPNSVSDLTLESLDRRRPSRFEEELLYSDSKGNTGTRVVRQVEKQGTNILEKDQLHSLESDDSAEASISLSRMSAGHDSVCLEQKGASSINHTYPREESESSWSPLSDSPLYDKHTYDTSLEFDENVHVKHQHVKRSDQNVNRSTKFFSGLLKKSLKDFGRGQASQHHPKVSVNGMWIADDVVKKAEEQAGPINPGSYWYDCEAGFWGAMGGPCLGIIPPFIEELSFPLYKDCSAGTTKVLVNGRELHEKDLQVLASRGLSTNAGRAYHIDLNGRVIDEISGRHIQNLGKLAPTVQKKGRGYGMYQPAGSSTVPRPVQLKIP